MEAEAEKGISTVGVVRAKGADTSASTHDKRDVLVAVMVFFVLDGDV